MGGSEADSTRIDPAENYGGRKRDAEGYVWDGTVQTSASSGLGVGGGDGSWT